MTLLGKGNFLVTETTVAKIVRWFVFSDLLSVDFNGLRSIWLGNVLEVTSRTKRLLLE